VPYPKRFSCLTQDDFVFDPNITRQALKTSILIGVISDTHGLLRPEGLAALRGSEYIIHAGDVGGISIYVLHDRAQLDLKPEAAGFRVVIYGHSHVPKQEMRAGVLYFNPGSAGPRRFKLPVTVGRLVLEGGTVRAEIVNISD